MKIYGSQFTGFKTLLPILLAAQMLLATVVFAEEAVQATEVISSEISVDEAALGREKYWQTLQKEAYYHFFLGDYLTAATRLKLLEDSEAALNSPEVLTETRLLLGSLYMVWGMHRPAAEIFGELIKTFPQGEKRSRLLLLVQKMQYEQTFYQAAILTYNLLSSEEGFAKMDQAAYFAGMSHIAIGSLKEGIKILQKIAPESRYAPYAKMSLAKAYLALNKTNNALFLLQDLNRSESGAKAETKVVPTQVSVDAIFTDKSRLTLGQLYIEQGRFPAARNALSQIYSHSPFYPDALFAIAWSHFKEKNELKSIVFFQDLIEKAPKHRYALEALSTIGHAYNRLAAYRKALDHYREAIKLYRVQEKSLKLLLRVLEDQKQLGILVDLYLTTGEGALADLIDTDRISSWIAQYGELSTLSTLLDKKLDDMAIFELIANHREEVFQTFLPSVNHSLTTDRFMGLNEKGADLSAELEEAIRDEQLSALGDPDEAQDLKLLSEALAKSQGLGKQILELDQQGLGDAELKASWQTSHRNLEIAEGSIRWKMISEVPGRSDDLRRGIKNMMNQLQSMSEQNTKLVETVPALSKKIQVFRKRIVSARTRLIADKKESIFLQGAILKSLQQMLAKRIDRRLMRVADWIATSELSRIQILDLQGGAPVQ